MGCDSVNGNDCTVAMNAARTVTAAFSDLTVTNTITGKITHNGHGLAGVTISASMSGFLASTQTDAYGNFVFNNAPLGSYALTPRKAGYQFRPLSETIEYTGGIQTVQEFKATDIPYSVSSGAGHDVVVQSDGSLWAWGANDYGQCGDGSIVVKTSPVRIGTDNNWAATWAGRSHTFGLKSDASLWAWGNNTYGQLGDGTKVGKQSPVRVGSANDWDGVQIAAGYSHTLALKKDGSLWAWGSGIGGELGDGSATDKNTPVRVGDGNNWVKIWAGDSTSVGLKSDGTLWKWGRTSIIPVQIGTDNDWIDCSHGQATTGIALKSDGSLWLLSDPLQRIGSDNDWVSISASYHFYIAKKINGSLWAWGQNDVGQLGIGSTQNAEVPTQIGQSSTWITPSTYFYSYHASALQTDGTLWLWGKLADGASSLNPVRLEGVTVRYLYDLSVGKTGDGKGSVTGSVIGFGCGSDQTLCLGSFNAIAAPVFLDTDFG
jgi:alpha-tubulin suppressor-like RCC1 family protein